MNVKQKKLYAAYMDEVELLQQKALDLYNELMEWRGVGTENQIDWHDNDSSFLHTVDMLELIFTIEEFQDEINQLMMKKLSTNLVSD